MELCVGGESIQAADTHMGMNRAVYHGPDWSGGASDSSTLTFSTYVCPLEEPGIKTCAANCASTLNVYDHMGPVGY